MWRRLIFTSVLAGLALPVLATVAVKNTLAPASSVSTEATPTIAAPFQAKVILAPHSDWMKVWADNTHPLIPSVSQVTPGEKVDVLLFFQNAALDPQRNVDVTALFQVFHPDGTQEGKDQAVTYKQALGPGTVFMIPYVYTFSTEAADPKGAWVIRVTFTDNRSHQTQAISAPFMAH